MLLELKNLSVYYETAEVIKDVSIDQAEGSVVSVIGANGAGKSTILKSISGLIPLKTGRIEFRGQSINDLPIDRRVGLGLALVPEGRRLFPHMSVAENIALGAYLRKDRSAVLRDLERVHALFPRLKDRRRQMAGSLSGGEQQMLAIGRALMARPKLLMMDEPSLGLAPLAIDNLAESILDINRAGISVLLVEQNAGLVTKVSQKCYVIEVGRVVRVGDIKELLADDTVRRAFLG